MPKRPGRRLSSSPNRSSWSLSVSLVISSVLESQATPLHPECRQITDLTSHGSAGLLAVGVVVSANRALSSSGAVGPQRDRPPTARDRDRPLAAILSLGKGG